MDDEQGSYSVGIQVDILYPAVHLFYVVCTVTTVTAGREKEGIITGLI